MRRNKYTAIVPQTYKAVKNTKFAVRKQLQYFLNNTKRHVNLASKLLDTYIAKSIRSFTKKRCNKK